MNQEPSNVNVEQENQVSPDLENRDQETELSGSRTINESSSSSSSKSSITPLERLIPVSTTKTPETKLLASTTINESSSSESSVTSPERLISVPTTKTSEPHIPDLADLFTKALSFPTFAVHRERVLKRKDW
ncbi:uncharacterized protein KGF55_005636 [Candida pseudojiufengensis]|uniref:uncharacterized protein n=1 Tax=Candida pseudojiufengensis TaxID=497109 RepID=UPI0022252326|nr:uncharacterized protein KGF55_005636 [Candida pseudojiufengensis]KAI5958982.1 hypothetical protein KGF55_005636 [Candida pseudojiufengensis]